MFKKLLFAFTVVVLALPVYASAQSNAVNLYFFWGDGCPHCAKEEIFLDQLEAKHLNVSVYHFEVWHDKENREFLAQIGETLDIDISGVPVTFVGDKNFIGYTEGWTDKDIKERVEHCLANDCPDSIASIVGIENNPNQNSLSQDYDLKTEGQIAVPILGHLDISKLSLPALTITLGALDGFNPCAMWALIFLITLLLGTENRRRMWFLGTAFIATSAVVYFLFMAAWLNLLLFVGLIVWVRFIIGLVAIIGGGYNLKEYFKNRDNTCKIIKSNKQQKILEKLKSVVKEKNFYLALGGIVLLAFAVNLVELFCSAGLPAVYTQILALNNLASWQYYLYLLLYVFVFMLDDLLVFGIAMITLKTVGITTKYIRFSHLIGGILMFLIGLALIFKPEWLLFG